jgi:2-dehydropantoate 2-reductase
MEIRKVALLGAGAIGGYMVWGMQNSLKDNLVIVAEGTRAERLRTEGMKINGEHYDLHVQSAAEASDADLLIVAVKYTGLKDAMADIVRIAGRNSGHTVSGNERTMVLSLLNGIDSEELIAEQIGWEPIVNAYMTIVSHRTGNEIEIYHPEGPDGLWYGDRNTPEKTEACEVLEQFFATTRLHTGFVPDILKRQWTKFIRNIAYNLPQAVLGTGLGAYSDSEHALWYSMRLEEEGRKVAAAYGIEIGPLPRGSYRYTPATRYSTLQDLDAKRPTEIDMFCGVLMKKAAEKGIQVPVAECTYHIIKALEEKNEGRFDYE